MSHIDDQQNTPEATADNTGNDKEIDFSDSMFDDTDAPKDTQGTTTEDNPEKPKSDADDNKPTATDDNPNPDDEGAQDANPDNPKETDEEKQKAADAEAAQKQYNHEQAQLRIQERNALNKKAQEYIARAREEVESEEDETRREIAELKARDAERDAREALREVENNQRSIALDNARVEQEVPMFRELNADGTPNPDFVPEAYEKAIENLVPYLVTETFVDENGKEQVAILGAKVNVHDFLINEARQSQSLIKSGMLIGQKHRQTMRNNSEPIGGNKHQSKQTNEESEMKDAFDAI